MPLQAAPRNFAHQMLREIYEQPVAIARTLGRYLDLAGGAAPEFREEPLRAVAALFRQHPDLIIAASGSSRHAGLAAEILLEDLAGLVVDVEYASEYACRSTTTRRHPDNPSPVLVLSQSGETADTLAALREAARRGHPTIAVTNVHGSTMAREATVELDTLAGVELAIPATKSFTTQLTLMLVLALLAARERGWLAMNAIETILVELAGVPDSIAAQLPAWEQTIAALAPLYSDAQNFLYLGRGVHYAIAREGALKLKESSYLHAEGYPAGELKHGPNALVSAHVPLVVLATVDGGRSGVAAALREDGVAALRHAGAGSARAGAGEYWRHDGCVAGYTHDMDRADVRVAAADHGGGAVATLCVHNGGKPRRGC